MPSKILDKFAICLLKARLATRFMIINFMSSPNFRYFTFSIAWTQIFSIQFRKHLQLFRIWMIIFISKSRIYNFLVKSFVRLNFIMKIFQPVTPRPQFTLSSAHKGWPRLNISIKGPKAYFFSLTAVIFIKVQILLLLFLYLPLQS